MRLDKIREGVKWALENSDKDTPALVLLNDGKPDIWKYRSLDGVDLNIYYSYREANAFEMALGHMGFAFRTEKNDVYTLKNLIYDIFESRTLQSIVNEKFSDLMVEVNGNHCYIDDGFHALVDLIGAEMSQTSDTLTIADKECVLVLKKESVINRNGPYDNESIVDFGKAAEIKR